VARAILQEWVGSDDRLVEIAITLEVLARHGVQLEKIGVRPETMREIRNCRASVAKLSRDELRIHMHEIYWNLVSTGFFGEERAVSPFVFLDPFDEATILKIISRETIDQKAAVILSLNERRAAKLIAKLPEGEKEKLVAEICKGKPVDRATLAQIVARLKPLAQQYAEELAYAGSLETNLEGLVPVLERMDFETQFPTARSLRTMDETLKDRLKAAYFNVAFLPECRTEFLARVFVDRSADWIQAVLSQFDSSFRNRVVGLLPPLQQRMLESQSEVQVLPHYALGLLRGLNQEVLTRIQARELSHEEIFDLNPSQSAWKQTEANRRYAG